MFGLSLRPIKTFLRKLKKGTFREDLYYRLNVIPFHIPPLRDRADDIPLLSEHFLNEFCQTHGRKNRSLSNEALNVLTDYPWPGNVRELKNLVERLIILTAESDEGKEVTAANILDLMQAEPTNPWINMDNYSAYKDGSEGDGIPPRNLKDARQEFEKKFIEKTLRENDGNVSKTAQVLGVERSHLHRKIKSFGIEV